MSAMSPRRKKYPAARHANQKSRQSGFWRYNLCRFPRRDGGELLLQARNLGNFCVHLFLLGVKFGLALRVFRVVGVRQEGLLIERMKTHEEFDLLLLISDLLLQRSYFGIALGFVGRVRRSGPRRGRRPRRRGCRFCARGRLRSSVRRRRGLSSRQRPGALLGSSG